MENQTLKKWTVAKWAQLFTIPLPFPWAWRASRDQAPWKNEKWMIQKKTFNINSSQVQEIKMKPWSQQSGAFDSHYQEQVRRLRPAGCLSLSGLSLSPLAPQLWELSKKIRKSECVTFVSSPAPGQSWQWWRERCPSPGPRGSRGTWSQGSARSRPRPCPRRPAAGSACTSTSTRVRCGVRMDS